MQFRTSALLSFLLGISFVSYSQINNSGKSGLIERIKAIDIDSSWIVAEAENQLIFSFTDTFSVCQDLSPIRRDGFIRDTLQLKLHFEDNWSDAKKDSIAALNEKVRAFLAQKIIAHFDSVGWNIKSNPEMVKEDPQRYWRFLDQWTTEELEQIRQLTRLPNVIIKGVGIFIDLNYSCIASPDKREKLTALKNVLENKGFREKGVRYGIVYN